MPVTFETQGRIAILTINRPLAMNALDRETLAALNGAWIDFRDNPELWVAIITGAGVKAFSSGADIKSLAHYYNSTTAIQQKAKAYTEPGLGGITRNLEIWKPIIAAINGYCLSAGLEIALACDIRIASETATFGLTEVTRGIIPGAGGTQRLPRLIPLGKSLEMILTGESIDAGKLIGSGLSTRLCLPINCSLKPRDWLNGSAGMRPLLYRPPRKGRTGGWNCLFLRGVAAGGIPGRARSSIRRRKGRPGGIFREKTCAVHWEIRPAAVSRNEDSEVFYNASQE